MALVARPWRMSLLLLALVLLVSPAQASEHLWAALFLGENRESGPQAPPALAPRLHEVFGFSHYEVLKSETVDLGSNEDHWVLSRKDFFLRLQPMAKVDGESTRLRYEIYKDGFLVANGVYVVSQDTPLFISGPDFQRGRLIFVLQPR